MLEAEHLYITITQLGAVASKELDIVLSNAVLSSIDRLQQI